MSYLIPSRNLRVEQKVKRSRFICHVEHCPGRAAADDFITRIKAAHADANHNCSAYIAGAPEDSSAWAMNDDGEPKGCAGKPMFNVLHHSGIGEICVVVTRYFGGIKLGTGGMARAYSSTVKTALEELQTTEKTDYLKFRLVFPYRLQKTVEQILRSAQAIITDSQYTTEIRLEVDLPSGSEDDIRQQLRDAGQGNIRFTDG